MELLLVWLLNFRSSNKSILLQGTDSAFHLTYPCLRLVHAVTLDLDVTVQIGVYLGISLAPET